MCETLVERLLRACSTCLARLGSYTNVLQQRDFCTSGTRLSQALMCDCLSELKGHLFLYVQNLQHVESFHTPDAHLGYTLMCDCSYMYIITPGKHSMIRSQY